MNNNYLLQCNNEMTDSNSILAPFLLADMACLFQHTSLILCNCRKFPCATEVTLSLTDGTAHKSITNCAKLLNSCDNRHAALCHNLPNAHLFRLGETYSSMLRQASHSWIGYIPKYSFIRFLHQTKPSFNFLNWI